MNAILALEDGTWFQGVSAGAPGHTEGEVVFNPKKNTTRELAASLERAGAPREAAMLRGGNGSTLEANLNFNGPLNMQLDLERAFDVMARRLGRALGADTG